jgi:hypothetical protein
MYVQVYLGESNDVNVLNFIAPEIFPWTQYCFRYDIYHNVLIYLGVVG